VVATSNQQAVAALLATLELDEAGLVKAAIAQSLAAKLDEATAADYATAGLAVAPLAKELRDVIGAILEEQGDTQDFVAGLFSQVGDPAHT
jgi:hypothetical protein